MHQNNGHDDQQPDYQLAAMAGVFARMDLLERRLYQLELLNKQLSTALTSWQLQRSKPITPQV